MQFEASESRGALSDTPRNYPLQYPIAHTSLPEERFREKNTWEILLLLL